MKAIVQEQYGSPADVLKLRDIDEPTLEDDRVLLRARAASVNPADWHMILGSPYIARLDAGLRKPKRTNVGSDVAGIVEAVGQNVTEFQPGDEVFGAAPGAYAELVSAREDRLVAKPANVTFEEAAAVPTAALTALQGLRDKGRIKTGDKVLINGASGGVGTFAVQIAKSFGAEVTGVCSTRNVEIVRSIGADYVIDYAKEDVTKRGERYDLILDNVGNHPLSACRRMLQPKGVYVATSGPKKNRWIGPIPRLIRMLVMSVFVSQRMVGMLAKFTKEDLDAMRLLLEAGDVKPVLDRNYKLSEVPDALMYLGEGHSQGKSVITVLS